MEEEEPVEVGEAAAVADVEHLMAVPMNREEPAEDAIVVARLQHLSAWLSAF